MLLVFGLLSLVSIWLTGVLIDRHHRNLTIMTTGLFALAAVALTLSRPALSLTTSQAADHADMAQSLLVAMENSGIAGGGLVGGILLAGLGVESLLSAVIVLIVPVTIVVTATRTHAFSHNEDLLRPTAVPEYRRRLRGPMRR